VPGSDLPEFPEGREKVLFVPNRQRCDAKPGWQEEETDGVLSKYWLGLTGKPKRYDCP
jgi:hypothetical protein